MDAQHTEGPWNVELSDDKNGGPYATITAGKFGYVGGRYMRVTGCIDKHDAYLISAAPDMREALDILESCLSAQLEIDGNDPTDDARIKLARAALAKAAGQEP